MFSDKLIEKLNITPQQPGVYLMLDKKQSVIYVGKALNLKKRLSSYFNKSYKHDFKTFVMIKKIFNFEIIITLTEKEALIVEANFIKNYKPKYNVILKDDKRYPFLRINIKENYPNITVVRCAKKDGAAYFGPYASPGAVRKTLKIINKVFKLRKCKTPYYKNRQRPCLNFQINLCLAPCCNKVDLDEYSEIVKEVSMFLKGRTKELIKKIKSEMNLASCSLEYEQAAQFRDKMFAISKTVEKQIAVTTDFKDRDVFAVSDSFPYIMVVVLIVRKGFLLDSHTFTFKETLSTNIEVIESFIRQYYDKTVFIPQEILLSLNIENKEVLENYFSDLKEKKVSIIFPVRGEKLSLVKMADLNVVYELKNKIAQDSAKTGFLIRLQKKIKMDKMPVRIECFDNSNTFEHEPVSCMVVFINGKSEKSQYRKYKIKNRKEHSDYAYMEEVLKRRYKNNSSCQNLPDLIMVDGGKGQLNIALLVLENLNLSKSVFTIGIAKKNRQKGETEDKIYIAARSNSISFGKDRELLLFLQKIRDEAHRFAISFHRKRRAKSMIKSEIDDIDGIGIKRKSALIREFKTIENIRAATVNEICAVPGISKKTAKTIKNGLNG